MTTVFRWTGIGKLVSFYRYFAFNQPRSTTATGVVTLLGIAAIRLHYLVADFAVPAYVTAYVTAYLGW